MMLRVTTMEILKLTYWDPARDMRSVLLDIKVRRLPGFVGYSVSLVPFCLPIWSDIPSVRCYWSGLVRYPVSLVLDWSDMPSVWR